MIKTLLIILSFLSPIILLAQNTQTIKLINDNLKLLHSKPDSALYYFEKAESIALRESDSMSLVKAYNAIGSYYKTQAKLKVCTEKYLKALGIAKRNNFKFEEGISNYHLGQSFFALEQLDESSSYYQNGLAVFRSINDSLWIAKTIGAYAGVHYLRKDYDSSISLLGETIEISKKLKNEKLYTNTTTNLAKVYVEVNKFDSAAKIYDNSIQYYLKTGNRNNLAKLYLNKGRMYFRIGLLDSAKLNANKMLRISKELGKLDLARNGYTLLKNISKTEGNYEVALRMYDSIVFVKDSVFDIKKEEIIANLNEKFKTNEIKRENGFLKESNELKNEIIAEKKGRQTVLNILIATLVGVVLLVGVFAWNRNRLSNKLKEQNTALADANRDKAMLMKELHHRVKNNFQAIKSVINNQDGLNKNDLLNKVEALSLVHQKLYSTSDIKKVESRSYFGFIVDEYEQLFEQEVEISIDIENEQIPTEDAISIGLFLTEAMNNAFKYGLKGEDNFLSILFNKNKLSIRNNGVSKIDSNEGTNYGTTIMNHLAKKLKAEVVVESVNDIYSINLIFSR